MIRLENVHKIYRDGDQQVHALSQVNLNVARGETLTIMGPSGSGKSTLLHILGCLDRPTKGRYLFDGKDVADFTEPELARTRNKRIGFVFQSFNLLVRETALENVTLPLLYAGERHPTTRGKEALDSVGLSHRYGHRPGQLSGGEQQRVAIARAIVKNPDIILADEPTGNLDSQVGSQIMKIFKKVNEQGISLVIITHSREVARFGDRTITIRDGKIESA